MRTEQIQRDRHQARHAEDAERHDLGRVPTADEDARAPRQQTCGQDRGGDTHHLSSQLEEAKMRQVPVQVME